MKRNNICVEIIAEVGVNHSGDLAKAKKFVDVYSKLGADTIKFQTVDPEQYKDKDECLYEIFSRVAFTPDQWGELKDYTERKGCNFLSTAGDRKSLELLADLRVDRFKVASDASSDKSFVNKVMSHCKPVIVSFGKIRNQEEVASMIRFFVDTPQAVMYCVSKYPPRFGDVDLRKIRQLRNLLDKRIKIGFSDHLPIIGSAIAAVAYGARVIEKHVKLDDTEIDAPVSLGKKDFKIMVNEIRNLEKIIKC